MLFVSKASQGACQYNFSLSFKFIHVLNVLENLSVIGLFVLMFYGPVNPMGSCRAWSVYLHVPTFTGQA